MRIAFVGGCFAPAPGGIARRVAAFGPRWVRHGHDVVVAAGAGQERAVLRREHHEGVRVVRTSVPPLAWVTAELRQADVVIASTSSRAWALAARAASALRRVPFVLELDGASRWAGPRADLVVGPSAAIARAHGREASAIGEGVDLRRCVVAARDEALRAELGVREPLVIACLRPRAIRACLDVVRSLPAGVRIVAVGEGRRASNVTFVPSPRPERRDRLVAAADVVAVSEAADVLEVMARGRAVLLVGDGEAAEIVDASGAGWAPAPGDPAALLEAIREAHDDLAGTWARGEVGRLHVAEHFDRDRFAAEYLGALERLVAGVARW